MTYRGTVHKGVVVLEPGAALPEGTPVTVAPLDQPAVGQATLRGPKAGSAKGKVRMSPDFDDAEYMR
jgi:hypothetical protein